MPGPDKTAGISLDAMRGWLNSYDLVSARASDFLENWLVGSEGNFDKREVALMRKSNALNGLFLVLLGRKMS